MEEPTSPLGFSSTLLPSSTCFTKPPPSPLPRAQVPALDTILGQEYHVLNHGFIRVIDYMDNDQAIVQAARVSYGSGTKHTSEDQNLINYLMAHRHTSPFEMCEIKLHVKMPIFVARQWIRHRTASLNEYSGRYSVMKEEFYIPEPEQVRAQSMVNKQGRDHFLDHDVVNQFIDNCQHDTKQLYDHYLDSLHEGQTMDEGVKIGGVTRDHVNVGGVAREVARINLPLSMYTEMYWKIDLHNLLHFLSLRCDSHAQYEIRVYADYILSLVKLWVPMVHQAFLEYRLNAITVSKSGVEVIRKLLRHESITQPESGMGKREWTELMNNFL